MTPGPSYAVPVQPAADAFAELVIEVPAPAQLALQIAASGGEPVLTLDGTPLPWTVLPSEARGRTHAFACGPGRLVARYAVALPDRPADPAPPTALDRLVYTRPSRYCPSDRFGGLTSDLIGTLPNHPWERALAAADLVRRRTAYVGGSSTPTDGALETLLRGVGVCRDFAHLVIALCRSVDVPARMVAVYAPGLSPMDFHAVVEVAVGDRWLVVDATGLAPRQSLVRIATGRDAADTAFLTNTGFVELIAYEVRATTRGDLPADDGRAPVSIA